VGEPTQQLLLKALHYRILAQAQSVTGRGHGAHGHICVAGRCRVADGACRRPQDVERMASLRLLQAGRARSTAYHSRSAPKEGRCASKPQGPRTPSMQPALAHGYTGSSVAGLEHTTSKPSIQHSSQ